MGNRLKMGVVMGLVAIVSGSGGGLSVARAFTFAVIGDRTGGAVPGVFEQVLEEVAFLDPDIIITVGDHIEGYEVDSLEVESQWDYIVGLLDKTGIEYHLTPGNHDIWDEGSRAIYRKRFGSPDKAFEHMGSLFIILDVSTHYRADGLPKEKLDWLESALERSGEVTNVFVFYHKPFWCEDFSAGRTNLLHDLFKNHGVKAVFTGHYHRHFYTERDGIRYFGLASSGGSLPPGGREKGAFFSYLLAKVEGDSISIGMVEPGFVEPADAITVEDAMLIAEIERSSIRLSELGVENLTALGTERVTVTIENRAQATLRDTATWLLRGGWTVEPLRDYVEVPPGETGTLTAFVSSDGQVFPVPLFTLHVPFADDRFADVAEPLRVRRIVSAQRAGQAPDVDGVLDEEVWKTCQTQTEFLTWVGSASPGDPTVLRVCYDSLRLYVGIECMDSRMAAIAAEVEERDGFRANDDNITVLLEPARGAGFFYQVCVNPIGTVFDQKIEICPFGTYVIDPGWDPSLEVGTQVLEDRWLVEFGIPLAAIQAEAGEGSEWGFNFQRWHQRQDVTSAFQPPVRYDSDRMALLRFK